MSQNQDILRERVKLAKVYHQINYKWFAEEMGLQTNSFYNWLRSAYEFGKNRAEELEELLELIED